MIELFTSAQLKLLDEMHYDQRATLEGKSFWLNMILKTIRQREFPLVEQLYGHAKKQLDNEDAREVLNALMDATRVSELDVVQRCLKELDSRVAFKHEFGNLAKHGGATGNRTFLDWYLPTYQDKIVGADLATAIELAAKYRHTSLSVDLLRRWYGKINWTADTRRKLGRFKKLKPLIDELVPLPRAA